MATDKQQSAQGKTVQFGVGQLVNPTPVWAKVIFRTILYLSGLWALLQTQFTDLPEHLLSEINRWIIVGNVVVNFTIKFIGWDFK